MNLNALIQEGLAQFNKGNLEAAEAAFSKILRVHPQEPNASNLLGLLRKSQGRFKEAEALHRQAIGAIPQAGGFHNNLGTALRLQGRVPEAIAAYRSAVRSEPANGDFHLNLGRLLWRSGEFRAALDAIEAGVRAAPRDAELISYLGEILGQFGNGHQAIAYHQRALNLEPENASIWGDLGSTYLKLGNAAAARQAYERSLELNPKAASVGQALLLVHLYLGDLSPQAQADQHRTWAGTFLPTRPEPGWENAPDADRRLRIGFLSPDFREHSVSKFVEPVLQSLDRSQMEIFVYSVSTLPLDFVSARIGTHADCWRDLAWLGTEELVTSIRADHVDILIELAGHSEGGRLDAIASRSAPVQVFWMGYAGTTGVASFQGRITDPVVDPPQEAPFSSEPPVRLPKGFHCFRPDPDAPPVSALPALEHGNVTFGSFNNLAKHGPLVLKTWASLLNRIPGSRLIMKSNQAGDPYPMERVFAAFEFEGIPASRLELLGRTESSNEHLAMYNRVDIALDTFPYNGVTTTCEALWMGVPVLTLQGDRPSARYGASLLTQAGLTDFIAMDLEDYLVRAERWSHDLKGLAELRAGLREKLRRSPLLDSQGLARELESALRKLWRAWCATKNQAPDSGI